MLVDEYLNGKLEVDGFITHSVPLEDINKAFDLLREGKRYFKYLYACR
jgi:S-(hydroxymethyl)glutathione dehydrogenase/alcohol dehydrogenase